MSASGIASPAQLSVADLQGRRGRRWREAAIRAGFLGAAAMTVVPIIVMLIYLLVVRRWGAFDAL